VRGFLDAVKVVNDRAVSGKDEALDRLVSRYPWLTDVTFEPPDSGNDEGPKKKVGAG